MRFYYLSILLVLTLIGLNAQTLNGKVYDGTSTVKGAKVLNKTQNRATATNENGDFIIIAKVSDTLFFESLFHEPKSVVLKAYHFDEISVFELIKIINELDEVEVVAEPEQPVFKVETYNAELQNLIQEDIKNHPEKYAPLGNNQGIDFVYLFRKLFDLIKKKKSKNGVYEPITYRQMDTLFTNNSFFNKRLITENLKIPEDKIYLFYDFCEAKRITSELLKDENKMQLLEELVINSQMFLILLEQYGEENSVKD